MKFILKKGLTNTNNKIPVYAAVSVNLFFTLWWDKTKMLI